MIWLALLLVAAFCSTAGVLLGHFFSACHCDDCCALALP